MNMRLVVNMDKNIRKETCIRINIRYNCSSEEQKKIFNSQPPALK